MDLSDIGILREVSDAMFLGNSVSHPYGDLPGDELYPAWGNNDESHVVVLGSDGVVRAFELRLDQSDRGWAPAVQVLVEDLKLSETVHRRISRWTVTQ